MNTKKLTALVIIMAFAFAFAGCGSNGGGSDQGAISTAVTDGIRGVVFTVPDGWKKMDVSKDTYLTYENPGEDVTIGVSTIDDSNLKSFADVQVTKTVEEYYKQCTSPQKGEVYEKEFGSASLLGQEGKTSKIKHGDGYVDIATYCMMDGVMYDFYIYRNKAYDEEGKIKPDTRILSDEELAIYEEFLKSGKMGDGASLQMKGVKADHLGELSFDVPEGFTAVDVEKEVVNFEKEDGVTLWISMVDNDTVTYYYKDEENNFKSLDEYYNNLEDRCFSEGSDKIKIAGYDGLTTKEGEGEFSCHAIIRTKDAVYNISMDGPEKEGEITELPEEDRAVFNSFIKSLKIN